jgi:hypothetical protein
LGQVLEATDAARGRLPSGKRLVDRLEIRQRPCVRGEALGHAAVGQLVRGRDLQLWKRVEHVQLGDGDAGEPVHLRREAREHGVEPPAAPRPAGRRAELAAEPAQPLVHLGLEPVGRGPSPTRVVYAFTTPMTASIAVGPMPVPVAAPAAVVFDDVTNG